MNNENNLQPNNKVFLMGVVQSEAVYSHELYGEAFYEFFITVPRLSNQNDIIPITVSERLMCEVEIKTGNKLAFYGQFRSYNKLVEDHSKLMLTVFVREFVSPESVEEENPNTVELSGYVCKAPVYRTTPFNREICDVLIAVNRAYNKSDYIPCIAWGRNARFVRNAEVGQRIWVSGRIQSRLYTKKLSETESEDRTAYELSINKVILN